MRAYRQSSTRTEENQKEYDFSKLKKAEPKYLNNLKAAEEGYKISFKS